MAVEKVVGKYSDSVREVVLGATPDQGGTRSHTITIGGDSALPFLHFEGEVKNRPVIAIEVLDHEPEWNDALAEHYRDVWGDPTQWAQKAVEEFGADLICLTLDGADPDGLNRSPEECAEVVKKVLEAVEVPLIVKGSGDFDKDNEVMPVVAEAGAGENLLLGTAEEENYKTLTAACMVHKHSIIALSPIDINICKQLNILINEMNMPLDRIVIDPSVGALGYGIEYVYSIMERIRLGTLQSDKMLAMPVICNVGYEAWRAKEAFAPESEFPGWGDQVSRGILWEAMTASTLLQAGAHLLVMRHPEAIRMLREQIDELMVSNEF